MGKAEAWGSCSPLYFDVHVVVGLNVCVNVGLVVGSTIFHTAATCWGF